MNKTNPKPEDLIAPCGMYCAVCSLYLAHLNDLDKSQCMGCRATNKKCTYLFSKCSGINSKLEGNAEARSCFECEQYPCKQIERMDMRYRENYAMSVKDNLDLIKGAGASYFIKEQQKKYGCPKCGGLRSVHNGKCFRCEIVTKLVIKRGKWR